MKNPHLAEMESDFLYHLGFKINLKDTSDIEKQFGDVKFICMGGTNVRMKSMAESLCNVIAPNKIGELKDFCADAHRYAVYKVGPVLCCSHGVGMASFSVLFHELVKLVWYAKCQDPAFIRIGTCGGVGVEPGTVIITDQAFNGYLKSEHEIAILGERVVRPAYFDKQLSKELEKFGNEFKDYKTIIANTISTQCFYEGQARIDGAFCSYTDADKMIFLKRIYDKGIRNIEMECNVFSSMALQAGVRAAALCVSFIDRLEGDQVTTAFKASFEQRPQDIVIRYIQASIASLNENNNNNIKL